MAKKEYECYLHFMIDKTWYECKQDNYPKDQSSISSEEKAGMNQKFTKAKLENKPFIADTVVLDSKPIQAIYMEVKEIKKEIPKIGWGEKIRKMLKIS